MWDKQTRFTVMVNALYSDLYRYAYWLCKDATQSEDLVQETFTRAWRSLDSLRDEKAAKSWLFTTLRREHARQYERIQPQLVDIDMETVAETRQDLDTSTEAFVLRKALADLSEEYRQPLVLQVLGGYSCKDIAKQLGLSRGAVMTRLFRARQMLREVLGGKEKLESEVSNL